MGRLAGDFQLEAAQMAGVAMEESQRLVRRLEDIATRLEDREALAVDQHPGGTAGGQRRRTNVKVGTYPDNGARFGSRFTPSQGQRASAEFLHLRPPAPLIRALDDHRCESWLWPGDGHLLTHNRPLRSSPPLFLT